MDLDLEARGILRDFDSLGTFQFAQQQNQQQHGGAPRSLDEAYALQRRFAALRVARGEKTIGFKVGCTGPKIRAALGIQESVHGFLWEGEQRASGAALRASQFRRLGIEGELALWLLSTEGPVDQWLVEYEPVVELHHFAFDGPPGGVVSRAFELIARNAIHAGVVHAGGRSKRCRLSEVPLDAPITVTIDGRVVEQPVLRDLELAGLRGPVATVTWLVERLRREGNGEELRAGDLVLAATPGSLIPLDAGSRLSVEFMGLCSGCTVVAAAAAAAAGADSTSSSAEPPRPRL